MTEEIQTEEEVETWFGPGETLLWVRRIFSAATNEIRIACGFFTIKGWNLLRGSVRGKHVSILVGIDEPGEDRARQALILDILRDLATGIGTNRYEAVAELVARIKGGQVRLVDARARSHHGKFYVADSTAAVIGSANTTAKGLLDQNESGTLRREVAHVARLITDFDNLFTTAKDITLELLAALELWLELASPNDIYLRTLLALEALQPVKLAYKSPVTYQRDMIAQTVRQIAAFDGSFLVASTGLGKTVVATHVALQLQKRDIITSVMIVGPKAVQHLWKAEMMAARLPAYHFIHQTLDKTSPKQDNALAEFEEIAAYYADKHWLIIIDESQVYRKRYSGIFAKHANGRGTERKAFTRLRSLIEKSGCKVLLLSGSPYSTGIDNINDQLWLLPHTAENRGLFDTSQFAERAWHIDDPDEFIKLPVASQLTTPHVAKYYGEKDEAGIFIRFGATKNYIPRIRLYRVDFPLFQEQPMGEAFARKSLRVKGRTPFHRVALETFTRVAWTSSPWALREILRQVIDTPGGNHPYKVSFIMDKADRVALFTPIIEALAALRFEDDPKLVALCRILDNLSTTNKKAIIFCERLATVAYLEAALKKIRPHLRVFSTVAADKTGGYDQKSVAVVSEAIEKFAPVANRAEGKHAGTFDLFMSTDAYGAGINLQDAPAVINYDIDWTPIDPVQRVGRILRPWPEARTIEVYTFVPAPSPAATGIVATEIATILRRWDKLLNRHDESQKLTDAPVLPKLTTEDVYLPDFASAITLEPSDIIAGAEETDISPFFRHTSYLQKHREYAERIPNDILSAKTYGGTIPLVFMLLKHADTFHSVLYDLTSETVRSERGDAILDYIEANDTTPRAFIAPTIIEAAGDTCLQAWCSANAVMLSDVERVCTLYIAPETQTDTLQTVLRPQPPVSEIERNWGNTRQ